MWNALIQHETIDSIMQDKGLAKIGDGIVNLCYSLAKSLVIQSATGEKVRDSVLARAIRSTSLYQHMGRRTDIGRAADAYEAIMAFLWLKGVMTIEVAVTTLVPLLEIDTTTTRTREGEIAARAFQALLEENQDHLPPSHITQ
ncbi:MAG: ribonuclease III family protein [Candidatus Thorarchaeota archaeon]